MKWFLKAAEEGERYAPYNLGLMYEHGEGIDTDKKEAFLWYSIAGARGLTEAIRKVDLLKSQLTSEELSAVAGRTRDWLEGHPKTN